jgi:aspartyl-tRNA(Asn)/glutamyl-tRNA(Gln) amidotransferase subunit C
VALRADAIEALARLAGLSLADEERPDLVRQLDDIVHYLDVLSTVDVDGIAPWQPTAPVRAPLRADIAGTPLAVAEVVGGAAASANGLVIVPRFVES